MKFKEFLNSINICPITVFENKDKKLRTWSITGDHVVSVIGEFSGAEIENLPEFFALSSDKLASIFDLVDKDMVLSVSDNSLVVDGKDITIQQALDEIPNKITRVPSLPEKLVDKDMIKLNSDDIAKLKKLKTTLKGLKLTISVENGIVNLIITTVNEKNKGKINKEYSDKDFKFHKKVLNRIFDEVFNKPPSFYNIYMYDKEGSPIKLEYKDENTTLSYFVAEFIEK